MLTFGFDFSPAGAGSGSRMGGGFDTNQNPFVAYAPNDFALHSVP